MDDTIYDLYKRELSGSAFEDEIRELFTALEYASFKTAETRFNIMDDATTDPINLIKICTTYLMIGNNPDKLVNKNKVKDLDVGKSVNKMLRGYGIKKGKNVGKYSLSQIAMSLVGVTIQLSRMKDGGLNALNDLAFLPLFGHIDEYKKWKELMDKSITKKIERKEGEVQPEPVNYYDLAVKGMNEDKVNLTAAIASLIGFPINAIMELYHHGIEIDIDIESLKVDLKEAYNGREGALRAKYGSSINGLLTKARNDDEKDLIKKKEFREKVEEIKKLEDDDEDDEAEKKKKKDDEGAGGEGDDNDEFEDEFDENKKKEGQ